MRAKGFIFDFNGTMFQDTILHEEAWKLYFKEIFNKDLTAEQFRNNILAKPNELIIEYATGRKATKEEIEHCNFTKESMYRDMCKQNPDMVKLADGLTEYLDYLKANSLPMAIATSSERTNVDFYIETFDLYRWFTDETIIYHDGSFRGKPHPDIYEKAAKTIGVDPSLCVVFEDAALGIVSARAAGVKKIVAVAKREYPLDFLEKENPDLIIYDFVGIIDKNI